MGTTANLPLERNLTQRARISIHSRTTAPALLIIPILSVLILGHGTLVVLKVWHQGINPSADVGTTRTTTLLVHFIPELDIGIALSSLDEMIQSWNQGFDPP